MKITQKFLVYGFLLLSAQTVFAARDELDELRESGIAANEWQLIRNDKRHNIMQYVKRDLGKSLRSFKIEYEVDGTLDTISRVTFDFPSYKRWYYQIKEARVLKKVSDREFYYYQVYRTPLVPDRDVIIHAVIEPYTVKKGFMGLKINAVPDYMPAKSGLVRMAAHEIVFKFTPVGEDKTKLEFDGYIDPSGVSPAWAINYYQRKSPYISVIGMQRMLLRPEYRETKEPMPFTYKE